MLRESRGGVCGENSAPGFVFCINPKNFTVAAVAASPSAAAQASLATTAVLLMAGGAAAMVGKTMSTLWFLYLFYIYYTKLVVFLY